MKASGQDPVLAMHGIGVSFGGLVALEDVSFLVPRGAVVGVIGPNGAGKTTLFNVITGFVRPSRGSMECDGAPFQPTPSTLAAAGLARTLQGVGLFGRMTALENVMVGAATTRRAGFASALLGLPRSDRDEQRLRAEAVRWLDRLGVAQLAAVPAGALPYPTAKRVALARALISRPRLLLLDEPAGGLGAEDIDPLAELIRGLPDDPESPCSVLLVEHHMELVMSVCDQVVVLDFGRVVATGTPGEVRANPAVAAAYLGEEEDGTSRDAVPASQEQEGAHR